MVPIVPEALEGSVLLRLVGTTVGDEMRKILNLKTSFSVRVKHMAQQTGTHFFRAPDDLVAGLPSDHIGDYLREAIIRKKIFGRPF